MPFSKDLKYVKFLTIAMDHISVKHVHKLAEMGLKGYQRLNTISSPTNVNANSLKVSVYSKKEYKIRL